LGGIKAESKKKEQRENKENEESTKVKEMHLESGNKVRKKGEEAIWPYKKPGSCHRPHHASAYRCDRTSQTLHLQDWAKGGTDIKTLTRISSTGYMEASGTRYRLNFSHHSTRGRLWICPFLSVPSFSKFVKGRPNPSTPSPTLGRRRVGLGHEIFELFFLEGFPEPCNFD
jgi:hypothetical protein